MTIGRVLTVVALFSTVACGRTEHEAAEAKLPTLDVTAWSDKTELFMEYPPLVAAQQALYAVHLTKLSDFSAMTTGRPRLEFTPENGGSPVVLQGTPPSRPGVYRVLAVSPPAGRYRWALVVDAPDVQDRHDLGAITVFANEAAARADAERHDGEDSAAIAYLKEAQWANGFGTARAREAEIRRALRVPAVIAPLTGGEAVVSAPAAGRFMTGRLVSIGDQVHAGQVIGRLEPRLNDTGTDRATLNAAVTQAQAAVEAARVDLGRAEQLLAERAVPARRVDDARRALTTAAAQLVAAQARLAQRDETLRAGGAPAAENVYQLRAPISGRIAEVLTALGASHDEGAPLFRVVRTDRVELQAHVPTVDVPAVEHVASIALELPGVSELLPISFAHMHHAGVLDPQTRALPIQFDADNRDGKLLVGQTATAVLYTGDRERMVVVPKEAVLTEAGRPYVFVQIGGESFSRRYVEVAAREEEQVGIRAGLRVGERVVTRGAYDVQLASAASGLPAEGHVH